MNDTTNVTLVGVGGQGILLTADVLARTAAEAGLDVKKSEIHGMAQRGGSVISSVRFGDEVHSPTPAAWYLCHVLLRSRRSLNRNRM